MAKILKTVCLSLVLIFLVGSLFVDYNFMLASSEKVNHLVISEIQIGEKSVDDEFIELYNPTDNEINLENWDLKRKTASGNEYNILNNIEGIIPARGYFLIIPRTNCGDNKNEACYCGEAAGDDEYTTNSFLAKNNAVLLYDDNGDLIDKVGWGEANDFEGEIISVNPENGESLERKIVAGAVQDTNNNNNDFVLRDDSEPQNSSVVNSNDDSQDEIEENNNDDDQEAEDENNNDDDEISPAPFTKVGVDTIIITEFLPNPEDSDKDNEFIEIYNKGEIKVSLSDWTLEDKMGKVKIFEIDEKVEIKAGSYQVFYSDETKITLNNSGDGVVLKDDKNNIIDETPVSASAKEDQAYALDENENWTWTLRPTAGRKNIIEEENKVSDIKQEETETNDDEDNTDVDIQQDDFASENKSNNLENETSEDDAKENIVYNFSDEIVISEIYPNPKGRDNQDGDYEWLELYNCSSENIDLIGWQIDDILNKGSKSYLIKKNKIIKARSHLILNNQETKVIFNNSGDEVNLLWPDGTVVDNVSYGKSIEEQSYNWVNDGWVWSQIITPNKNNTVTANGAGKILSAIDVLNLDDEDETEIDESDADVEDNIADNAKCVETTITKARELPKFTCVKISGIVSTPPEIFSDNVFYIAGSGIQVYSEELILEINIGDEIEVTGRISEIGGEKRILIDRSEDLKIISNDNLVESKVVSTGNVNETFEGYLITVEGKVARIKSDVFYLDDGSGEIKIYLKPQTGIIKPEIKIGDWMVIVGQVSQTSVGYRILPRFQGDLKLSRVSGTAQASSILNTQENVEKNEEENKSGNFVFYGIIIVISFLILVDWIRIRKAEGRKK